MIERASVTGIVLAGGRSSRFGSPKLEVRLDGGTLLELAIEAVVPIGDTIIVAGPPTTPAGSRTDVPIRVLADAQPFAGPLVALAGALRATATELVIVVGGDMPFMVTAVLESMLGQIASNADIDAVVLGDVVSGDVAPGPRRQVLPLALRVGSATTAAATAIAAGDRSLVRLLDRLNTVEIPASRWLVDDPTGQTLLDIDVPADLHRILRKEIR